MYYSYIVPITIIIINMNVLTIISHLTNILEKWILLFCWKLIVDIITEIVYFYTYTVKCEKYYDLF